MPRTEWSTRRSGWGNHLKTQTLTNLGCNIYVFLIRHKNILNVWAGDDPLCGGGQWPGVPGQWQEAAGQEDQVGNHWRYNCSFSAPFFPFLLLDLNAFWETLARLHRTHRKKTKDRRVKVLWVNKTMLHSLFRLALWFIPPADSLSEEACFVCLGCPPHMSPPVNTYDTWYMLT